MTLLADLLAARARIERPHKWCKGVPLAAYQNCALTALPLVVPGHAERALGRRLPEGPWGRSIAAYNDHPDTTHADIMALYDRAIANERYAMCLRGLA